jgi:maltose/maltodextrin transport system substrate-binding protein
MKTNRLISSVSTFALFCIASTHLTHASEEGTLLIWTKKDFGTQAVKTIGERFAQENNIAFEVHEPTADDPTPDYNRAAVLGRGPDIFLRAHDRIGELAEAELIEAIQPSNKALQALGTTFWNAARYNGKIYGYPVTVEGVTQICNTKLQAQPFTNFNQVESAGERLKSKGIKPLLWHYYDNYFSYGFLTSEGGYAFEFNQGTYNPGALGVNNSGAVKGVTAIKKLLDKGFLPTKMDYGIFDAAFKAGKTACIINGPWSWGSYREAGIEMSVGPLPSIENGTPRVFTGVLVAVINPASKNIELAKQFLEDYLLQPDGLNLINNESPLGAVTHTQYMNTLAQEDPLLADAYEVWKVAEPMPNITKMSKYWTHMDTALIEIYQNNADIQKALDAASTRIAR